MKTLIIMVVSLYAAFLSAQSWTSVKETNINVNGAYSVDIFTNGSGNHIIVQESNALKYYKMNVSGTAGSAVTLESSAVVSPSISGDATRIYVVYRKSSENYIRTKYSSDGGTNWSYISDLSYNASSIECVFSNNKLHVTYEVSNVVYYAKYAGQSWSTSTVSTNENGNYPRIAAWYTGSEDKVYFFYQNYTTPSIKKWREYNVTSSSWGTLYEAFNISYSSVAGLSVDANYVYFVASYMDGQYNNRLLFYTKNKSNGYVNSFDEISNWGKCYGTVTVDGYSHIPVYWYYSMEEGSYEPAIYRKNGTQNPYSWDQVYYNINADPPEFINVSSASNDVHVIWKDNLGNNNGQNLRYKYDDQVPLAPQNLAVTSSQNNHPLLTWPKNNEPDVNYYTVERSGDGEFYWETIGQTSNTFYEDQTVSYCTSRCAGIELWYRIKAVDYYPHESSPSDAVVTMIDNNSLHKISSNGEHQIPDEYSLANNFPNPFNPTTKITYALPKEGLVTIKVYDVLGNEVAELINGVKPEGFYEAEFNADNLPSGIYIYRMQAGKFTAVNKMILMR